MNATTRPADVSLAMLHRDIESLWGSGQRMMFCLPATSAPVILVGLEADPARNLTPVLVTAGTTVHGRDLSPTARYVAPLWHALDAPECGSVRLAPYLFDRFDDVRLFRDVMSETFRELAISRPLVHAIVMMDIWIADDGVLRRQRLEDGALVIDETTHDEESAG